MKKGHVFIRRTIVLNLKRFNRMLVKWSIYFAMKLSFLELCELKVFDSLKLPAAQADRTDKTTQRDFKISAIVFLPKSGDYVLSPCGNSEIFVLSPFYGNNFVKATHLIKT